jgi:hypothetical protein
VPIDLSPDQLVARILDLETTLAMTRSADLRETIRPAIADCEARLAALDCGPADITDRAAAA